MCFSFSCLTEHSQCVYVYMCVYCFFSHVQLFATLWTLACKAPLSMGFSRQEYWSGLPCPPPGELPHPRDQTRASYLLSLASAGRQTRVSYLLSLALAGRQTCVSYLLSLASAGRLFTTSVTWEAL